MAGVPSLVNVSKRIEDWSPANNPFFNGANADLLALLPFIGLCALLYLVGRDTTEAFKNLIWFLAVQRIHASMSCFHHTS